MADQKKRLSTNIAGDFFVDSTCINCDACRQIAPATFSDVGEHSSVSKQPLSEIEERNAWHALLACPVGAIGCAGKSRINEFRGDFPLPVDAEVYFCGFNSRDSFGANSYFITHPDGNWLIDSPRYVKGLAERFEKMGGIKNIFLSHRDDVADADRYAAQFGSRRIIHKNDIAGQPDAEIVVSDREAISFGRDFLVIPTPGHTEGHCVLLYKNKYLFSGDHLSWNREHNTLQAYERYCWFSWDEQKISMKELANFDFEWVLPGHGQGVHLSPDKMKDSLHRLIEHM